MISNISVSKKIKINIRKQRFQVIIFSFLTLVFASSCNLGKEREAKHVWIDFNDSTSATKNVELDTSKSIKVAIASIISPQETFNQYNNILKYIEEKLNRKVVLIQRKTYKEVNALLKKNEIDLAFICSGAYINGTNNDALSLLVIPVRNDRKYYQAYLIAHKESEIKRFGDLKNKKFVFSDSLSNTGMLYPLKRLKDLHTTKEAFFAETYFSHAHDYSIELVSRSIVAGASVNSLIYDYIAMYNPEKISNIKIIEKSEWFGMPPIVVAKGIDNELKENLLSLFTQMHTDEKGSEILKRLLIDKYIQESDTLYNGIREMCKYISCK